MKVRLVATGLAALLLSGCWGLRDISELAIVLAVGIDRTERGLVRVTAQIARPAPGGGPHGGGDVGGGATPARVVAAEAPTIFEAIRKLAASASRRIMWAHNQVIVIGQAQAEHGINEVVDFFTRNPELRYRTVIALAEEDAQSVVAEQTGLESLPGVSIEKAFRYAAIVGVARRMDVKEFAASAMSDDTSPVLPVLRLAPRLVPGTATPLNRPEEVEIAGMAIFREGRLAATLDRSASRGLLMAQGRLGRAVVSVPCPAGDGDPLTVEVVRSDRRIRAMQTAQGGLRFDIAIQIHTALTSVGCAVEYRDPAALRRIEQELTALFSRDLFNLLETARESGTDPAGLGRYVRARLPHAWRRWNPRWPEGLREARLQQTVHVTMLGSEVLLRPTRFRRGVGTGE